MFAWLCVVHLKNLSLKEYYLFPFFSTNMLNSVIANTLGWSAAWTMPWLAEHLKKFQKSFPPNFFNFT
jgi:hypothetical protein